MTAGGVKQEIVVAREIRARGMVAGLTPAQIAAAIQHNCEPVAGTTWIRAYRLALGISLADVAAQVRAWYETEGRKAPKFSETLLSAYESGQKRPGPEYLHYLCIVYRAEPADLGYPDPCFCGRAHRAPTGAPEFADPPAAGRAHPAAQHPTAPPAAQHPTGPPAAQAGPGVSHAWSGTCYLGGMPAQHETFAARHLSQHGLSATSAPEGAFAASLPDPRYSAAEDDDDILRRTLLRLIAHGADAAGEEFYGAADRIRRRMDDALVSGTVSVTMLDQWEETAAGYGRQYVTIPPIRLLCDVLLDFGDVRRMTEQRQPLEFGDRLCRLAAQLAGLSGMIMIDVGHQRMAKAFFRTARTAADETGDRHLRAWVAIRESFVPLYYGDPAEAAALARAGGGLAGRNPCVAGAMAPVLEARSLARAAWGRDHVGRRQALRRVVDLLGLAHGALDRLAPGERADAAFGYTERQLLFHEGDALVALGDHDGAERAFTRALELYAPQEMLDRSLVSFGLARCRLEEDEPEEALRLSRDTLLGVPPAHRSEILLRAAWSLGERVAGRHGELRAVREYREALVSA